jgi:hypothetical protein
VAEAQQIEHDDEHEHDSPTSESGFNSPRLRLATIHVGRARTVYPGFLRMGAH